MKGYIYSYDILDTCLLRKCGRQDFLYEILANEILGINSDKSDLFDFVLARKKAEQDAKEKNSKEDVSILEIYDCLDVSFLTKVNTHTIMEKEIELHESMLVPVNNIKKEIDFLHKKGIKVIYISDMYLPAIFFTKVLKKYGFLKEGDRIYVSGDLGKTKASGSLYYYVKNDLDGDFNQWIHRGDNVFSDNKVPHKLGIKTRVVKNLYSYYEREMINKDTSGSFLDIQKVSACSRAVRLSLPENPQILFASDFIAPIYTTFVFSLLKDARKRKFRQLFFMARDSYIFYLIAKELQSLFPEMEFSYLYASRTSLYLPGLHDLSVESLMDAFPVMSENIEDLLSILGLPQIDVDIKKFEHLDAKGKVKELLNNRELYDILECRYKQQSNLCIRYFEQIGLSKPYSAVVDVFGSRKSEMFINRILRRNGYSDIYGYYFGVMWSRVLDDSNYNAMFYAERMKLTINDSYYTQKQSLFEQFFSITNQQRTIGYILKEGIVIPQFEVDSLPEDYKTQTFKINKVVCEKYAHYYSSLFIGDDEHCCQTAQSVFNHFFHVPRKDFLAALYGFSISDNGKCVQILRKCNLISIVKNKASSNEWFHGLLIYNSGFFYKLLLILLEWLWNRRNNKIMSSF